jgi:WD40 repeat protein
MQDGKEVMFSHSDGEVWGLDVSDYPNVCTSGDDNKVIIWDTKNRKKKKCLKLTDRAEGKGRG